MKPRLKLPTLWMVALRTGELASSSSWRERADAQEVARAYDRRDGYRRWRVVEYVPRKRKEKRR